jgi:hypothetical protein
MKPPEAALRQLVRQWLDKAAADFEAAGSFLHKAAVSGKSLRFIASRQLRST